MKLSNKKLFFIALIFAILATSLIYYYLVNLEVNSKKVEPTKEVVIARETIYPKTRITKEMIEVKELKEGSIPPSIYKDIKDVIGRIAKETIYGGEPVNERRLADDLYKKEHLSYSIPKGYRAITLPYNLVMGVGGFIQPGDYVDVIGIYDINLSPKQQVIAKIFLQNVQVLAVGGSTEINTEKDKKEIKTITLAVTPKDAEKLTFTSERASLKLMLRSIGEGDFSDTAGTTKDNIFNVEKENPNHD